MDLFTPIDRENWAGEGQYKLYTESWLEVAVAATVRIDASALKAWTKEKGIKFSAALIYATTKVINRHGEFRRALQDGVLGTYEYLCPVYPYTHAEDNVMSFHTVDWADTFKDFYENYLNDQKATKDSKEIFATPFRRNGYIISVMPFMPFSAFSFDLGRLRGYYLPIVEIGKLENGQVPFSLNFHHAVINGRVANILFEEVRELLKKPQDWCIIE